MSTPCRSGLTALSMLEARCGEATAKQEGRREDSALASWAGGHTPGAVAVAGSVQVGETLGNPSQPTCVDWPLRSS